MVTMAIVLVILFVLTLYKSSIHIQSTSYYVGLGFIFVLLIVAVVLRLNQNKLKDYIDKKKNKRTDNSFLITSFLKNKQ